MKHTKSLTLATIAIASVAFMLTACQNAETTQMTPPAAQPVSAEASAAARMATPPFTGTTWVLQAILGSEVSTYGASAAPELQLASGENRVTGSTPVNRFNGSYTLNGETVGFMQLVTTRMAGDTEAMRLETAYLKVLGAANRWKVVDRELHLFTGPAEIASFKAKP